MTTLANTSELHGVENKPKKKPFQKKLSSRENLPLARVRRHRLEIDNIKHDNEILRLDYIKEDRESRISQGGVATDIAILQDQAQIYLRKIDIERRKIEALDHEITEKQAKVLKQKQKVGGINASKENDAVIAKQIKTLENKLDKSLIKFNEALAVNKSLREKIDSLRRERVVFDGIYKKLERDLHEKRKEMTAIIEDSKAACIARDKAQSEIAALRQQAEKDRHEFDIEWAQLNELIEMDRQKREEKKEVSLSRKTVGNKAGGDELSEINEEHLIDKPGTSTWNSMKDKSHSMAINMDKIQVYEEAFAKIQETTGIEDVEELIVKFLEAEDKNFSLFNYVNELNSEIEQHELMIHDAKTEIEKHKGQGVSTDTQQKRIMRVLEERLQRTRSKADEYENRHCAAQKTINQLKTGIHGIFTRLNCANSNVEEMLGSQGVTESNMMQYLGIIEQRTIEILQTYAASQVGTSVAEATNAQLRQQQVSAKRATPMKFNVQAPTWDDFSSGEESDHEDDERPLTREELQRKTLKGWSNKKDSKHKASKGQQQRR